MIILFVMQNGFWENHIYDDNENINEIEKERIDDINNGYIDDYRIVNIKNMDINETKVLAECIERLADDSGEVDYAISLLI